MPRPLTHKKEKENSMEKWEVYKKLTFRLSDGVQVRPEEFGLLFYDYAGPKLYFVPCKNLVDDFFFCGEKSVGDLVDAVSRAQGLAEEIVAKKLAALFNHLKRRNLIREQPLC